MSSFEHVLLSKNEVVYVDRNDKKSKITVGELSPGDKILGAEGMYDVVVSDGHQVKEGTLHNFRVLPNIANFQAARVSNNGATYAKTASLPIFGEAYQDAYAFGYMLGQLSVFANGVFSYPMADKRFIEALLRKNRYEFSVRADKDHIVRAKCNSDDFDKLTLLATNDEEEWNKVINSSIIQREEFCQGFFDGCGSPNKRTVISHPMGIYANKIKEIFLRTYRFCGEPTKVTDKAISAIICSPNDPFRRSDKKEKFINNEKKQQRILNKGSVVSTNLIAVYTEDNKPFAFSDHFFTI